MNIIGDINPYLRAIGRLIVNFNALEHSLRRLAWILIDPQDDRTGQIVIDTLGTARIEELVKALLSHRIRDEELRTKLVTLTGQVAAVRGRRNDFAHAFWRVPNEAADLTEI